MSVTFKNTIMRPWTPLELLSCILWLDGADSSTITLGTGVNISQWDDKSSSSNHVVQGTEANQPDYSGTQNGKNVVRFDGNQELTKLTLSTDPNTNDCTWFAVAEFDVGAQDEGIFSSESNIYRQQLSGIRMTGVNWIEYNWNTNWHVATCKFRIGGGNDSELLIDGVSQGVDDLVNAGTNGFRIGSLEGGSFLNGNVAEIIRYDRILTDAERILVEDYLTTKWGL